MAHLLLAHKKLHAGEDGIGPAPSGGAVAAAARASASPRSRHRSLFSSIVPQTELYFTPTKLVRKRETVAEGVNHLKYRYLCNELDAKLV